jgi:hypothetical protein
VEIEQQAHFPVVLFLIHPVPVLLQKPHCLFSLFEQINWQGPARKQEESIKEIDILMKPNPELCFSPDIVFKDAICSQKPYQ